MRLWRYAYGMSKLSRPKAWLKRRIWRVRWATRRVFGRRSPLPWGVINEKLSSEWFDGFTVDEVRRLTDEDLHEILGRRAVTDRYSLISMCDAELRRRDAWASPAARAVWISLAAFLVAAVTLILNIAGVL